MTRGQPRRAARALGGGAVDLRGVGAASEPAAPGRESWPVELLGHHASLPLAFAILYQDYPFALADLFLKRALTRCVGARRRSPFSASLASAPCTRPTCPAAIRARSACWSRCGSARRSSIRALRDRIGWFVDTVVLHRPDYGSLRAASAHAVQRASTTSAALLDDVCAQLAPALSARLVRWREVCDDRRGDDRPASRPADVPASPRVIAIRTEPPRYVLEVGS